MASLKLERSPSHVFHLTVGSKPLHPDKMNDEFVGTSSSKYILVIKNIHYSERLWACLSFSFTFRTFQRSLGAFEVRTTNLQLLHVALLWWPPCWTVRFVPKLARFLNSSPMYTRYCARVGSFGSSACFRCFKWINWNSCNIIHWRKNS